MLRNVEMRNRIIRKALEFGADLAGVASVEELKLSPSYNQYERKPYYDFFESLPPWPEAAPTVLIFAVRHPRSLPELDWWDPTPGGTPGNRELIKIQRRIKKWLASDLSIGSVSLPYKLEKGGIFLKDSAVLSGVGVIGKNNLLLTEAYGAQIRLRGMFLEIDLEPSPRLDFAPCDDCDMPCFAACPQDAFRSGLYDRDLCQIQMRINEENVSPHPDDPETEHVRYCRACELACPVGRD
jgi:epoxyqueuosine reductase